jgi:hypothetical protein
VRNRRVRLRWRLGFVTVDAADECGLADLSENDDKTPCTALLGFVHSHSVALGFGMALDKTLESDCEYLYGADLFFSSSRK